MTSPVKGFRQKPQPNKKEIKNALDGVLQNIDAAIKQQRQNTQVLLQMIQRTMGDTRQLTQEVDSLEALIGYRTSNEAAVTDDVIVMSCIGYDRETGLPFAGGRLDRAVVRIGSKQLIPSFEEQLVGLKASDQVISLDVVFPEDYQNKELAGKTKTFDLVVLEVFKQGTSTANFEKRAEQLAEAQKAENEKLAAEAKAKAEQEQASEQPKEAPAAQAE